MQAGKLHVRGGRVEIQAEQSTATDAADRNLYGEQGPDWQTVATVWASVEPLSGRELWQAQQVVSEVTHRVRLRHNAYPGLTPKHRFRVGGSRILGIAHCLNLEERNREWECLCAEEV